MERRQQLRNDVKRRRLELSSIEISKRSAMIVKVLRGLDEIREATTIMAYVAFGGEADINGFWQAEMEQGKTIVLPRIREKRLEPVRFLGWDSMQIGNFGIQEPLGEPFPFEEIEAVLVPGLVFDRQGNRLGFGKGYYDRFLPQLPPTAFFCGIAYDFQVVEDTFPTPYDVKLHEVVTEQGRIIRLS